MAAPTGPVDLGILLAQAYQGFVRELRASLAEAGFDDLGRSDGYVFRALTASLLTVGELAARLEVTKQAAGQIVEDMERRGYVERRADPRDGRARLVQLSARGAEVARAARRFHRRYEQRLARRHGAAAVASLRALLDRMAGEPDGAPDRHLRALYL
jgi:DNA-binding MarR family transcriptional regulator